MIFKSINKTQLIILLSSFVIFVNSQKSIAQVAYTAVPFLETVLDVRMQALGNSFVSFYGNEGAYEINPASIINTDDLSFNFTKREWNLFSGNTPHKYYQYGIQSGIEKWGISYRGRYVDYAENSFGSSEEMEYYHNLSASYNNEKNLRIGLGLNYIYSYSGELFKETGESLGDFDANALSVDIGFAYERAIEPKNDWTFTPSIGSSLSDFGTLVKYSGQEEGDPLPMRFRTGMGLTTDFAHDWNGFQLFRGDVAFAISKFLIAIERDENGDFQKFGPFETLVKAWGSFEAVDPNTGRSKEYSLGEQLIFHSGLELNFLESFSFRLGYQNGQELNSFYSIRSVGFGIDLYYIALDYVNSVQYDEDYENIDTPINGEFLQVTGRIPLDGKSPKSLLRLLF